MRFMVRREQLFLDAPKLSLCFQLCFFCERSRRRLLIPGGSAFFPEFFQGLFCGLLASEFFQSCFCNVLLLRLPGFGSFLKFLLCRFPFPDHPAGTGLGSRIGIMDTPQEVALVF